MKAFTPYLNFDGNTREAMTFYQSCLGGQMAIQTFGDVRAPGPPGSENRVMHARLECGNGIIMASDTMPGMPYTPGNNVHINIDCENVAEIERFFAAFSQGANVIM